MALPTAQQTFLRKLDPSGRVPYYPVLSQGATVESVLQTGENVISFAVAPTPQAVAAGLRVISTGSRAPTYGNLVFSFWVEVDPSARNNAIFDTPGIALGVEVTFETDRGLIDQFTVGVRTSQK